MDTTDLFNGYGGNTFLSHLNRLRAVGFVRCQAGCRTLARYPTLALFARVRFLTLPLPLFRFFLDYIQELRFNLAHAGPHRCGLGKDESFFLRHL